jgi:RND superfamily putative drug exporter
MLGFIARVHTVSVFALNITTVVGLGLGIDYSLLVVNRFRDELRAGYAVNEAVARTVGTAGLATAVSGGTVLIGFGALMLSNINVLWSLGLGGACVVGVSVLASLTLIPALLALFGHRVNRLALPYTRRTTTARFWSALAHSVMRRPFVFIAASLALMVVIALPTLHLNQGVIGSESLPPNDPAVTAERLASDQFAISPYQPILVVARGVSGATGAASVKQQLLTVTGGNAVRSVADVAPAQASQYLRSPYAVLEVEQTAPDNDPATRDLLDRIRGIHWNNGVSVLVGGEAAAYQDFLRLMAHDVPVIVAVVVGLTMLLLGIVFRSVVLPIKAVLMNMLSVGAGIGVLVWIFQDGHLASQLDIQAAGFIDATLPPIIFAAVFGLSMDYEVFLLSRVREEHLRGHDNADAVALGVARTGQIITSAALIMIVVFSSLALSHLSINKSFGVTFAVAIFLDATVIRLLLVPAMMRVMGRVNWWPGGR